MALQQLFIAQQVFNAIRKSLRLNRVIFLYATECSHDRVARARNDAWIRVNVPYSVAEFAHKAISEGQKLTIFRFVEAQIVKEIPHPDGKPRQTATPDSTEPANEKGSLPPGNPIGD
jgi:hypothetical protein